jgi:hypothetical protein
MKAPIPDLSPRRLVQSGSLERLRDPLERGRAELVSVGVEQSPGHVDELAHGLALASQSFAQRVASSLPGEQLGLSTPNSVARVEQLGDGTALGPDELIDRPGRQ